MSDDNPRPVIPEAHELYNFLMNSIEPDLKTTELDGLEEKYENESPEEQDARMKRYTAAFAAYEKALHDHARGLSTQIDQYRKKAFASAEADDRTQEEQEMSHLENLFSSQM